MNHRLHHLLETITVNIRVLNEELQRFERTEQFNGAADCEERINNAREEALKTLSSLSLIDRKIRKQAELLRLQAKC